VAITATPFNSARPKSLTRALAWRLSNKLDASFCIEALKEAIAKYGKPKIMNTDSHMMVTSSRVV
jgi:hypothetical protein